MPIYAEYELPSYQINHLERVVSSVRVPNPKTEISLDKVYYVAED